MFMLSFIFVILTNKYVVFLGGSESVHVFLSCAYICIIVGDRIIKRRR
jgi:small basic protein